MSNTTYTSEVTVITAETMQDLNDLFYVLLGGPAVAQDITDALPFDPGSSGMGATALQAAIVEASQGLYENGLKVSATSTGALVRGTGVSDPADPDPVISQDALIRLANGVGQTVADIGFDPSVEKIFKIQSYQAGGLMQLGVRNDAGALRLWATADSNGEAELRSPATDRTVLRTGPEGVDILGSSANDPADGVTAGQSTVQRLLNATGDVAAVMGFSDASNPLRYLVQNMARGGGFLFEYKDAAGAVKPALSVIDGQTKIHHAGVATLVTSTTPGDGVEIWRGSAFERALTTSDLAGIGAGSVVSSALFDTGTGDLTLSQSGGPDVVESLDGRYLTSAPVASVAGKTGAVTLVAADIGGLGAAISADTAVAANTLKETNATHTGDVTGASALTIAAKAVTLAKMQDFAAGVLLGRVSAGVGPAAALTAAEVRTLLNVADGATSNAGTVTNVAGITGISGNVSTSGNLALDTAHARNVDHSAVSISTTGSLTGGGSIAASRTLQLAGDVTSPGGNKYYGTDAGGSKGFHTFPAGSGGNVGYFPTSVGAPNPALFVHSELTFNANRSVGRTGSPSDVIWTAMDNIPVGVTAIKVRIQYALTLQPGDPTASLYVYAAPGSSGPATSDIVSYLYDGRPDTVGLTHTFSGVDQVTIPLHADGTGRFRMRWSAARPDAVIYMYLVGWEV
jgi:hypothetical protein